jgi:chromosome segregation ATPase
VQASATKIQQHVVSAQKTAQDLKAEIAKQPQGALVLAQPYVDTLLQELDNANAETNVLKGTVSQLTTEITSQTAKANSLADSYDKAAAQIQREHSAIMTFVKLLSLSVIVNLACLAWIFRRPIGAMFGI